MSRIGKQPIEIPKGVEVKLGGSAVTVKGPKGQLAWDFPAEVRLKEEEGKLIVQRINDSKPARAMHGLARSLINNMVTGVTAGFKRELEIVGVGFKAQAQGTKLVFNLGYSHPVEFQLPEGVKAEMDKKQVFITLSGIDKQVLGQAAADIRALRKPDVYKGKGIRFAGERIKLKAGKSAKTAGSVV